MASRFLDTMRDRPLLLDSGMGLRLILAGHLGETEDSSRANIDESAAVLAFHREDIQAGSDAILTNTFAANRTSLARAGRGGDFEAINRAGAALAREAAGPTRFVIGSIGPVPDAAVSGYREQAEILIESGVDALVLETHLFDAAERGLGAISPMSSVPVLVSLHHWPDDAAGAARRLVDLGASAVGSNCGRSTADVVGNLIRLAGQVEVPLLAKPSTGTEEGPEVFAALLPKLLAMGVRLVGGCCGTTTEHIAAMRTALTSANS